MKKSSQAAASTELRQRVMAPFRENLLTKDGVRALRPADQDRFFPNANEGGHARRGSSLSESSSRGPANNDKKGVNKSVSTSSLEHGRGGGRSSSRGGGIQLYVSNNTRVPGQRPIGRVDLMMLTEHLNSGGQGVHGGGRVNMIRPEGGGIAPSRSSASPPRRGGPSMHQRVANSRPATATHPRRDHYQRQLVDSRRVSTSGGPGNQHDSLSQSCVNLALTKEGAANPVEENDLNILDKTDDDVIFPNSDYLVYHDEKEWASLDERGQQQLDARRRRLRDILLRAERFLACEDRHSLLGELGAAEGVVGIGLQKRADGTTTFKQDGNKTTRYDMRTTYLGRNGPAVAMANKGGRNTSAGRITNNGRPPAAATARPSSAHPTMRQRPDNRTVRQPPLQRQLETDRSSGRMHTLLEPSPQKNGPGQEEQTQKKQSSSARQSSSSKTKSSLGGGPGGPASSTSNSTLLQRTKRGAGSTGGTASSRTTPSSAKQAEEGLAEVKKMIQQTDFEESNMRTVSKPKGGPPKRQNEEQQSRFLKPPHQRGPEGQKSWGIANRFKARIPTSTPGGIEYYKYSAALCERRASGPDFKNLMRGTPSFGIGDRLAKLRSGGVDPPFYDVRVPLGHDARTTSFGKRPQSAPASGRGQKNRNMPGPGEYKLPSAFDPPTGRFISPNMRPWSSYGRLQKPTTTEGSVEKSMNASQEKSTMSASMEKSMNATI
ncbi:unnamed protein product [Amoebophrya sp. A25]|nr:unnamed protein product [Amoebophrya sp. A25]|eukprot:GSA25T00008580001.1